MTIKEALENANREIRKQIDLTLEEEVAEAVKMREAHVIDEVVYGALIPVSYERRGGMMCRNGGGEGLGDIINMEHTVKNGVLSVTNETLPNPYLNGRGPSGGVTTTTKPIASLVEYGIHDAGGYGYDYAYVEPRPFTKKTVESLSSDKLHVRALKKGLARRIGGKKVRIK